MSAYFWNDYLLFTPSYYDRNDGSKKIYSILMIFGFPNGTDFTIDIAPYLMDTGYYIPGYDLVTRLLQNLTIDNNIFGFKSTNQIKIKYLPEQLLLYDTSGNQLFAESIIDKNHILNQNFGLIKNYELYSLNYQYIVIGTENDLDTMTHDSINYNS